MEKINLVMGLFAAGMVALSAVQLMDFYAINFGRTALCTVMAICWAAAGIVLVRTEIMKHDVKKSDEHPEAKE